MSRITLDTIKFQLDCVNRAHNLPLQFHAGPEGFVVGSLRLVRMNGVYSLMRIINNAGAGDDLSGGLTAREMYVFLKGMAASKVCL